MTTNKSLVNNPSMNSFEYNVIALVVSNKSLYEKLKERGVGKTGVNSTYGAGPLGYDGLENKQGSAFAGVNRADPNRFILVYRGSSGQTLLESALQDEELQPLLEEHAEFSRLEVEGAIPVTKELEVNLFVESVYNGTNEEKAKANLTDLAASLTKNRDYRPKAYYSESKNHLVLGSSSTAQLTIAIEKQTSGNFIIAFKAGFHATAAANIWAATLQSSQKKLDSPVAMSIMKLLSNIKVNPVMNAINELCSEYYDTAILLTKRQRDKVVLNTKVIYAKGGLNSILKHMELLPEEQGSQYAIIMESFIQDLIKLAKTNGPAKKALGVLQKHMGGQVNAPSDANKKTKGGEDAK